MKKILPLILLSVASAFMFFSCKKAVRTVRCETLFAHTWKITNYQLNGIDQPLDQCNEENGNNVWYFNPNFSGTMVINTPSCEKIRLDNDSTVPADSVNFQWSITGDQLYAYVNGFAFPDYNPNWTFVHFSSNTFTMKGNNFINGTNYVYYKTFTAVSNL